MRCLYCVYLYVYTILLSSHHDEMKIGWHCFNHRLELSVHDAVKACTELNHFKIFMQKLYTVYSAFPKNRRGLEHRLGCRAAENWEDS